MPKIKLSKLLFILFLASSLLFLSLPLISKKVYATSVIFEDNFNNELLDKWEIHLGSEGEIRFEDGELLLKAVKREPDDPTYVITGDSSWIDYRFEVKLKGEVGVDKTILFRTPPTTGAYQLKLLDSSYSAVNNLMLLKGGRGVIASTTFPNSNGIWYRIRVDLIGSEIKIYIDDMNTPKLEYNDPSPTLAGGIALMAWTGAYAGDGSITINRFDDVVVTTLPISSPPPSPTPTPSLSPTPQPLDSIILLPGLGASWNHGAMILNQPVNQTEWYITPFVKTYDGLIQSLKNSDYEDTGDDRNLFIFNYDWRQPIEATANQLRDYIENTIDPPSETNIDLIGHSLGGMVARTYVQNNPDHRVDQLVTIGSPHKGASKIYYLWEGADLNRTLLPWQRIGAGILLHLNKKDYKNNVETIRQIISGLKDLLPTFSFLEQDGVEKPLSEMNQRNNWLESLNQPPLPGFLTSVLNTILGAKENSTLRWINVENRNRFDRFLGKWEDGRPVGEEFNSGDETVLVESAQLEGASVVELSDLNHGDLVETTTGQKAIMDLLGLSPSEFVPASEISYEPSLVFQLASPATPTVFGPDGWQIGEGVESNIPNAIYSPADKLIIIPNPKEGDYQVQVNKEGEGGDFRLLIGKLFLEEDIWQEFEDQTNGEPKIFTTTFSEDPAKNKLELLRLAKQRLELMRNKVLKSRRPFGRFLASVIKWKIRQIDRAIRLLQRGKENRGQRKIKATIFNLFFFEKNLKFWAKLCRFSPEFQQELLEDIRIAKDYLVQAYEL